jgi:hypothetical protein
MRTRRPAQPLVALAAGLALLSCGGDSKDSARGDRPAGDAVALTRQASGPNRAARTGVVDGTISFRLNGVPGYEQFTAGVSGPFSYRKDASLPDYDLQIGARDYGVGLTSVGGRSYVSLGTTGYPLPADVRRRLVRSSAKGDNGLTRTLEQFGIAPWRWETEQRIAGSERVDGVAVTRVATGADVGRILRDANTLLRFMRSLGITRAIGLPREIGPAARRVIAHHVTSFRANSWIGVADHVLRRSGFTMKFAIPQRDRAKVAGISGGTVVAELNVTEVGKPHEIAAPTSLGDIADFKVGIDALGDAQDAKRRG